MKEIEKKQESLPAALLDFEPDAGAGFGNADTDSFAVPFLLLLQALSPQVQRGSGNYVEGAQPGMFINSATGELYDGVIGVSLIPIHFQRIFVQWRNRESGGGFMGERDPIEVNVANLMRDERGHYVIDDESYLCDTRRHYCVQITDAGPRFVIFSLSSSQTRKSRNWLTQMQLIKLQGQSGMFTPPTYSQMYHISSILETKDQYRWYGVRIEHDHQLTDSESGLYQMARVFLKQIKSGRVTVEETEREDGIPF